MFVSGWMRTRVRSSKRPSEGSGGSKIVSWSSSIRYSLEARAPSVDLDRQQLEVLAVEDERDRPVLAIPGPEQLDPGIDQGPVSPRSKTRSTESIR